MAFSGSPESFWALSTLVVNTAAYRLLALHRFHPGLEGLDQWRSLLASGMRRLGANFSSPGGHVPLTLLLWVLVLS